MLRTHRPLRSPDHPVVSLRIPSSPNLCELCASAFSSPSCFTLSLFCKTSPKINPSFSYSSALSKKVYFDNPFPINSFRTLWQNTGGGTPQARISSRFFAILAARYSSLAAKSRRIRTYEKTGEGGPIKCSLSSASERDPQRPSVTLIGVPFWEHAHGNGGVTRVKTLGR
jgi:hypothetical protein